MSATYVLNDAANHYLPTPPPPARACARIWSQAGDLLPLHLHEQETSKSTEQEKPAPRQDIKRWREEQEEREPHQYQWARAPPQFCASCC